MKKLFFRFLLLILAGVPVCGYPQERYPWGNADMIIKGDKIWVLSLQETVSALDINTGKTVAGPPERNNNFVAIDTDRKGSLILARYDRSIVMLDEKTLAFKELYTSPKPVYAIVFDSDNKGYAVTSEGVTDLSTGMSYTADTSFRVNYQIRKWQRPSTVITDSENNIWIGSGLGEWGGELYVFNMTKNEFIKTNIKTIKEKDSRFPVVWLNPVQSIISLGKFVYVSFDFGNDETEGCIMRFNGFKCDSLIVSGTIWPPKIEHIGDMTIVQVNSGDYAGPALYNEKDNCLYFYSHSQILKGQMDKGLSKPEAWSRFNVNRKWTAQSNNWGVDVLKMAVAPNGKLYLLSQK